MEKKDIGEDKEKKLIDVTKKYKLFGRKLSQEEIDKLVEEYREKKK